MKWVLKIRTKQLWVAFDEIISLVQEATEFDSIEIDGVKPLASTSKRSRRGKVK